MLHSIEEELKKAAVDLDIDVVMELGQHAHCYRTQPRYPHCLLQSTSWTTRWHVVRALRKYADDIAASDSADMEPMDSVLCDSEALGLVAQGIVNVAHQHPHLFPNAASVTADEVIESFDPDENALLEARYIDRAQRLAREGSRFDSLHDFVGALPQLV